MATAKGERTRGKRIRRNRRNGPEGDSVCTQYRNVNADDRVFGHNSRVIYRT